MRTSERYRTIWISDLHLGTKGAQAHRVLDFLRHTDSDTLYLVGDVVDGWMLKKSWYWPQAHNDVIQKLLRKARKGTKVVFIPGNHDEFARSFAGLRFGDIPVAENAVHWTADGRKLLIMHGDEFDLSIRYARGLAVLGGQAYGFALWLNRGINWVRRRMGLPYWSFASFAKQKVKKACQFISDFEDAMVESARQNDADGVVCGHIHKAELRMVEDVLYANAGDWVESCTALVEHEDGRLELIEWPDVLRDEPPEPEPAFTAEPAFTQLMTV